MIRTFVLIAALSVMALPSIAQERRSKLGLDEDMNLEEGLDPDGGMDAVRAAPPAGRAHRLQPARSGKHSFETRRLNSVKPLYSGSNALDLGRDRRTGRNDGPSARDPNAGSGQKLPLGWPHVSVE